MSKIDFIRKACDLHRHSTELDMRVDWLGPVQLQTAACWNFALWGGVDPPREDVSEAVAQLGKDGMKNSRPERRDMIRRLAGRYMALSGDAPGDATDPAWRKENQFFICSATEAAASDPINWTHWWLEIRNIELNGWQGPKNLLLETVPGKALTIRRGEEIGDYAPESDNGMLQVGIPVEDLTTTHYGMMDLVHAAKLMIRHMEFKDGAIPERLYEYFQESGLWDRLLAQQVGQAPKAVIGIAPPQGYLIPSIRRSGNHGLVTAGGSGTIWRGQDDEVVVSVD